MANYDNDRRYDRYNDRNEDRNWFERATDEVSSWFSGDDNDAERHARADYRRGDARWSDSDRNRYQTGNFGRSEYGGSNTSRSYSPRRADGYNYDYDNDFDGGQSYSRYGGPAEEHRGTQNIRSYGRDQGYDQSGRRTQFESDYDSNRGYYGQDSSESYRGNRGMNSQGNNGGMNDRYSSSDRSQYGTARMGQSSGNYDDRYRYGSNGGSRTGSASRYNDTQYGTSGNWGGMEDRSYMGGHSNFDMNEGRTGRNDWSSQHAGADQRYGSDQGYGRSQDREYNDRSERDYTRGYGNRYGSHNNGSQNYGSQNYGGSNYNSGNYGRR